MGLQLVYSRITQLKYLVCGLREARHCGPKQGFFFNCYMTEEAHTASSALNLTGTNDNRYFNFPSDEIELEVGKD